VNGIDPDQLPDGVLVLDADLRVVDANATACSLTGYQRDELVGQRCDELLDPHGRDGRPVALDGWHPSAQLRSVRLLPEQDLEVRRADGSTLPVRVTGSYRRGDDGALEGAVVCLRDATRRAHAAAQGIEVISTVSHELRSPLTSVKGYTSLLLNRWERLGDEQKRMMLEQVHHDADRVTRLVTELLDISRLESGRLVLRRQLINLPELVENVVGKVRMEYADMDVDISFPPQFPRVFADPDKVEQVLTNLVENAAKYADPKGMRIVGEVGEAHVAVSVIDQGEGIPEPDLARIFTKFFRRAETRPTGSGLGLWISRGLAQSHGGSLTADSTIGRGSTFRFVLPYADFDDPVGGQ
jgi:PAS domain S-box-containing protein